MKKAKIEIEGKSALLFHKFTVEVLSSKSKPKGGTTGNNPDEWKTTMCNEGKRLYIPKDYFFSCFGEGAKYVKVGRGTLNKKFRGCVIITTPKAYLNRELPDDPDNIETENMPTDCDKPVYIDIRGVKNPATKGRNVRYRLGLCPGWECTVELEFDDTVISKDDLKRSIEAAGKFVGLADNRENGYGRFEVLSVVFE